ncbi:DnaJ C terminal domain-containing protein [Fragilaria crotonensis]|nr:DnaJ C terminal domain-containing protein [Fragilaria crotonensis]
MILWPSTFDLRHLSMLPHISNLTSPADSFRNSSLNLRQKRFNMERRCALAILCLLLLVSFPLGSASPQFNPYSVLGVPKTATSDEIRRKYRKLCLQYHPDKNVQKSAKERKKCEDIFKNIQKANALIGDDEARRNYEQSLVYSFPQQRTSSPGSQQRTSSTDYYNDILRRYYQQQQRSTPSFSFGGVDISNMFSSGPAAWTPFPSALKSKYIQKIQIPLQDLYSGKYGVDLILKDTIWNRYSAAFRGGVASMLLYQSLVISISMIRIVRFPWSLVVGAICFHLGLPKPTKLDYMVDLQPGWKQGTKLSFCEVERGFDVVFIIEEAKHKIYKRVGNDLYTSVTIDEAERENGCTVCLDSLHQDEGPISITLQPNQIRHSGESIVLSGMGWPGKKGKQPGDLIVSVNVENSSKKKRKKKEARH